MTIAASLMYKTGKNFGSLEWLILRALRNKHSMDGTPLSLRSVLIFGISGVQILTTLAVVLLIYFGMERAISSQAKELLERRTLSVADQVVKFFTPPIRILETQRVTMERDSFDLDKDEFIEMKFFGVLRANPELSSLFYARSDGSFLHISRLEDSNRFSTRIATTAGVTIARLERNSDFEPIEKSYGRFGVGDPREQGWFKATRDADTPVWSDDNRFITATGPLMTLTMPIVRDGELLGVVGTDIDLWSLGAILRRESRNQSHTTTIFTHDSHVALYVSDSNLILDTSLPALSEYVDPIPETAFATKLASTEAYASSFRHTDGADTAVERFLGHMQPLDNSLGLPWVVALHAKRSDLSGGLQDNISGLVLISVAVLLLLSLVSIPIANQIRSPLVRFSSKTREASMISPGTASELSAPYSELKVTEKALAEEITQRHAFQSAYEQTFKVTSRGEAWIDPRTLRILQINDRLSEMLGLSKDDAQGRHVHDILVEDDLDELRTFSQIVLSDKEFCVEAEFIAADANTQWLRLTAFLIRDDFGAPDHALAIFEDLQETHNPDERLEYLKRDLYHVSRINLLGQFAAGLAHELNQPLGALVHDLDSAQFVLEEDDLDRDELRGILNDVDRHAHRAGEIIRALRDLIQKDMTDKNEFELDELLKQTLSIMEPEARMYNASIEVQQRSNFRVFGNRGQLAQVLVNLIRNALEALGFSGRSDGIIRITAAKRDAAIVISIEDNGPGFPAHIKPFVQFQSANQGGLGLGLSICKSLVEANDGTITYQPVQPNGTKFVIELKGEEIG